MKATPGPNGQFGAAYKRFLCARGALTAIYHNVIRNDLMRRVIHPAIYVELLRTEPDFIDRPAFQPKAFATGDWEIPFEFSHGAFRFGHAMVRPEYQINDLSLHDLNNTLEKSSVNDPANMPLDETWMVQWSRFFEINGSTPNFSRRIGPHLSDGLGNDQIFPAFDETERVGLLYRDLLGAGLAGMWSVDALIAEIGHRRPQLIAVSRLLTDRAYRVNQLREWLATGQAYGALTDAGHRNPFERSAAAVLHPVRGDAADGGPATRAARLDHRIGSDIRSARERPAIGRRRLACRSTGSHFPRILSGERTSGHSRYLKHGAAGGIHHRNRRAAAGRARIFVKRNSPLHATRRSKTMAIERMQVTNHERWGNLVKTWSTGKNYLDDDNEYPIPTTVDEFKEQLAKAQVFMTVPERFKQGEVRRTGAWTRSWCACRPP